MGIKIQLCAGNGGNSQNSQNSQFHSQKFPNRSNPYTSIIPTGNMVGNSLGMGMVGIPKIPKIPNFIPKNSQIAQTLIHQSFPLGIWLGIVWEWEWWEFPKFPN